MFFTESDYYTGPPLTDKAVRAAEDELGVKLPGSYIALLRERNGGIPRRLCVFTDFRTSWGPDHIEIAGILGIGGEWGIDGLTSGFGSRYIIREWGYPDIGVVICTLETGDVTVMLDYSGCGSQGEPTVVYVDEDRVPREIAGSFADFIAALVECPEPDIA